MNKLNITYENKDYIYDEEQIETFYLQVKAPINTLKISAYQNKIIEVSFFDGSFCSNIDKIKDAMLKRCITQLNLYFKKQLNEFDLDISLIGSSFRHKVLTALTTIPYGNTTSYSEIARLIKSEKSARAVGNTNRQNPVAIIIPCHRIIGKNKNLIGYNGGLDKKKFLLDLEK